MGTLVVKEMQTKTSKQQNHNPHQNGYDEIQQNQGLAMVWSSWNSQALLVRM